MTTKSLLGKDYAAFVRDLKSRIASARVSAARAVNRDLILLYWDIGRAIVEKQERFGWGESVVEMLAGDLKKSFPRMPGFSAPNLWRMRQFYSDHTSDEFLSQVRREIGRKSSGKSIPILSQFVREIRDRLPDEPESSILSQVVRELVAAIP